MSIRTSHNSATSQASHRTWKNLWFTALLAIVFCVVFFSISGRRLGSAWIRYRVDRAMECWAISPALQWLDWGIWLEPGDGGWDMMRARCYRSLDQMAAWQESLESAEAKGVSSEWIEAERTIGAITSGHVPGNTHDMRRTYQAAGLSMDDVTAAIVRGYLASGDHKKARTLLEQWEAESVSVAHQRICGESTGRLRGDVTKR